MYIIISSEITQYCSDIYDYVNFWLQLKKKLCVCSIHPRDKQDVAYRLALGARAVAYKETGVSFQGPFPGRVLIENTTIIITYDQKIRATLSSDTFEVRLGVVSLSNIYCVYFKVRMWQKSWRPEFSVIWLHVCYRSAALRKRSHVNQVPSGFLLQWRTREVIMSWYQ